MSAIGKMEFAKEIGVSSVKLDQIMSELELEYKTSLRDRRLLVISDEDQDTIREKIGI